MSFKEYITVIILSIIVCVPSVAFSDQEGAAKDMSGSVSVGYSRVDDANSYSIEVDFVIEGWSFGVGAFMIDSGNLPGGVRDYPPPGGVATVDVGGFDDNEKGGYVKVGKVFSDLRVFGILGGSSVDKKYVVRSTLSGLMYVAEEETGDFRWVYGAGAGYLLFDRLLLQYQYDNRRRSLFMVGLSF